MKKIFGLILIALIVLSCEPDPECYEWKLLFNNGHEIKKADSVDHILSDLVIAWSEGIPDTVNLDQVYYETVICGSYGR